jgi:hypothetical protein
MKTIFMIGASALAIAGLCHSADARACGSWSNFGTAQNKIVGVYGLGFSSMSNDCNVWGNPGVTAVYSNGTAFSWDQGGGVNGLPSPVWLVHGSILSLYNAHGGPAGDANMFLGFPRSNEFEADSPEFSNTGRASNFENGTIYCEWNAAKTACRANFIQGAINYVYNMLGAQAGALGYPTSNEFATTCPLGGGSGCRQSNTENGTLIWYEPDNGNGAIDQDAGSVWPVMFNAFNTTSGPGPWLKENGIDSLNRPNIFGYGFTPGSQVNIFNVNPNQGIVFVSGSYTADPNGQVVVPSVDINTDASIGCISTILLVSSDNSQAAIMGVQDRVNPFCVWP